MAKTIAIQLEIDGAQQAVKTIGELETAIEQLTEELKSTDIGSERFNQLTVELNDARSALKGFEQTFEGLDPQQKTQAYVSFGEAVASGILFAQEALRSFGIENESVNDAVEKSTQAINLALQARIVLEGALEARVIATTLAQRALNTATVAGSRALKVLFTTLAANPLGAVLAVVGLLVTAFIALSDSQEEATTSLEAYNDTLDESLKKTAVTRAELEFYGGVVNDVTRSEEERKVALDELNKAGVITDGITLDNVASLDKLNERLELARENIILKAQSEAAASLLAKAFEAQIEAQSSTLEDNIGFFDKFINTFTSFGNGYVKIIQDAEDALENQRESISKTSEEVSKFEALFLEIQEKLLANEAKLKETREDAKEDQEEINDLLKDFTDELDDATNAVDRLNRELLEFGETPEPKIIEDLKELVELQLKLREVSEENRKTLGDVFTNYLDKVEDVKGSTDVFGDQIDLLREQLTRAFLEGDIKQFAKNLEAARKLFFETGDTFNEEQKRAALEIIQGYEVAFGRITELGIQGQTDFNTIVLPLLQGLTEKLRFGGENDFKEAGGEISKFILTLKDVEAGTDKFFKTREDFIKRITEELVDSNEIEKMSAEDREAAIKAATEAATEQADAIIGIITNTTKAEDAIRGVLFTAQQLSNEIKDTSNDFDEIFGLIIDNFDAITEEFDVTKLLDPDPAKLDENLNALTDFFKDVSNDQINLEEFTQEQRIELLEEFLEKRKELIEKNTKEEEDIQKQSLEETLGNLQEVLSSISQVGAALAENSQFQISVIQRETEALLDEVVGDTKEAAELREEIQEDATRKIVELERQAELRSLQFAKIEAISQLAVATVRALALPPPFNAIATAAVGTAGSLQIGLIQSQIEDLKSVPGFAQGGLVQGEGNGTSDSIPAMLSNGEFVVNAKSAKEFLPLLEQLNERGLQKFAQGGFVLDSGNSNPIFMGNTSFDDSRIIDALERRDTTPLRAYVFEKEITDAQDIERRLQELSKL